MGSGIVESAHRRVLQVRMKRPGQRWGIQRAGQMVRLRAVYRTAGAHHFHRAIRDGLKSSTPRADQLRVQPNAPRRVVHNYTKSRSALSIGRPPLLPPRSDRAPLEGSKARGRAVFSACSNRAGLPALGLRVHPVHDASRWICPGPRAARCRPLRLNVGQGPLSSEFHPAGRIFR